MNKSSNEYNKKSYYKHRETRLKTMREMRKLYPWKQSLDNAKQRCENPNCPFYYCYGGRGIEFHLTYDEGGKLWFRDKAYLLKRPSINRKDNDGDYTFDNCEFIEKGLNTSERNSRVSRKSIIQLDLNGKLIKIWNSTREASKQLNIDFRRIGEVARGERASINNYIWEYINE
jgi:hypothetical protein